MATLDGAEALGMDGRIGSLTPGKKADLQIINAMSLNVAPRLDWVGQVVFNGRPDNVEWVFVDGQVLKQDGRLVADDTERVLRDAQLAADRIKKILEA